MSIHVPSHQDDRRNDRLAKQAMDTHKILGASGAIGILDFGSVVTLIWLVVR